MFLKSINSRAAGLIAGGFLFFAASNASASLCNGFIATNWNLVDGPLEITDLNQSGGFIGCSTQSVVSGNASFTTDDFENGAPVVFENAFSYSVRALDDDTIRVERTATVEIPDLESVFLFPGFTLELTDIQWVGSDGSIQDVDPLPFLFSIGVSGFTADSITFALERNTIGQSQFTNETFVLTSDFDIVVTHSVPEPGTLALFALGIAWLGVARRRRETTARKQYKNGESCVI
ncbi:MAG: PEP-CTERM sorting domain-containing protein [Alphaproteobacteria bacterium]|nr:PEP-CTERM sorting domain-containing protein [Alphaproteobacteria bacterium]